MNERMTNQEAIKAIKDNWPLQWQKARADLNASLEQDYIKRWGNAQKCLSCGHVSPFGPYDKAQNCCGKKMELAVAE